MLADIDYVALVQQFGIMGSILVGVLLTVYRAGKWIGVHILQPVAERHIAFVERLEKIQLEHGATLKELSHIQQQQTEILQAQVVQLTALHTIARETRDDAVKGRSTAVDQLSKEHAEILRRLPGHKA